MSGGHDKRPWDAIHLGATERQPTTNLPDTIIEALIYASLATNHILITYPLNLTNQFSTEGRIHTRHLITWLSIPSEMSH